ncbi:cupin-like domain-containing protein [Aquabacterium sp.]|uniref:cupin-like domain-containing protein n=1 Tax=Aquabacterium sp. TaxID=1872578 RepID=UPI0037850973
MSPATVPRLRVADAEAFARQVVATHRPAVIEAAVAHWPAVDAGRRSAQALAQLLARLDSGAPVDAVMVPPGRGGRIFYDDTLAGFNFLRRQLPVSAVLEQLLRYSHFDDPPAVAVQSALIADCLPGWLALHPQLLLPEGVAPRLWLGNRIVTPAHFDESRNLACVVAGRRRFTLFPPECIVDLYVGPLGHAPTGTPISLVDFAQVDAQRFPRFANALAQAWVADLAPGDALYIPPLWWHHVQSLDRFNLMVNYWWPAAGPEPGSALDALLHAVLALRPLPDEQRRAWAALFEHYVFGPAEAATAHLPADRRAFLADLDPALARQLRAFLRSKLDAG